MFAETPRIILREFVESDFDHLLDLDSDPEVMRYLTDGRPSTPEEVRALIARFVHLNQKYQRRFGIFAAIEKISGEFMGWFFVRPCKKEPDNVRIIELGYRLKKVFWGKGFATEGAKALVEIVFQYPDVEEIFATTMKANKASQKVMGKIGMNFVCDYQEDLFPGYPKEAVRYSLKRALK